MKSGLPKVLHKIAGLPMIAHVLGSAAIGAPGDFALVVGRDADAVARAAASCGKTVRHFVQEERLGTAHAVLCAREAIRESYDDLLVMFGDTPLVRPETIARMRAALADGAEVCVLGFHTDQPEGYGRLVEVNGELCAIREERDATPAERQITFCNSGIMAIAGNSALQMIEAIGNENVKGEYYLTDIVAIARHTHRRVVALEAEKTELIGVDTRSRLADAEAVWQAARREHFLSQGITMQAPHTVFFSHDTQLGADCVIEPNVWFGPGVKIAESVHLRAFCHLEGCSVAAGATIGPFARLRPGASLGENTRIGNFCEIKNAEIAAGTKVNHLSYVGDATLGESCNVGAGAVTCNFDGIRKHRTEIGNGAFIGTNAALVAPVRIGDNAYIASGSVIVEDVPDNALAVARGRQINKEGYARRMRQRSGSSSD
jgi:bifunctional UDP-N-acetylglucosamine pyrophosphorylase / glucosamine-1-phosphate N-acetyltransferase